MHFLNLVQVIIIVSIIGDTNGKLGEQPEFILRDKYNTMFPILNFDCFPQQRIQSSYCGYAKTQAWLLSMALY